ncbi:hypothetical protein [Dishui Lake virophage 6]|nr:hypothetical protein [Dishui Lake virophage 6]
MADITEKRILSGDIVGIINKLKYKDEPISIQGSAKLAIQKYYSDIDLFSQISEPQSAQKIYSEIRSILKRGEENRIGKLYFIELKVQNTDESKTKFNNIKDFTRTAFLRAIERKNLDYIKIDYVLYLANTMTELSVIYNFIEPESVEDPLKALQDEVREYESEGNLFKAKKRLFSIYNIQGKTADMVRLTRLFNSPIGALYQMNSQLKAVKLLLEHHSDDATRARARFVLKELGVEPTANIDEIIKTNDDKIQNLTINFFKKK